VYGSWRIMVGLSGFFGSSESLFPVEESMLMSDGVGSNNFRNVIKAHYEFLQESKLLDYEQRCYQKQMTTLNVFRKLSNLSGNNKQVSQMMACMDVFEMLIYEISVTATYFAAT